MIGCSDKDKLDDGGKSMLIKIGDFEFTEVWDGVLYKKLSEYPKVSDWEIRNLIEFIDYENSHGRECKIESDDDNLLGLIDTEIKNCEKYLAVPRPKLITECTACPYRKGCFTDFVCHTTSIENAKKIEFVLDSSGPKITKGSYIKINAVIDGDSVELANWKVTRNYLGAIAEDCVLLKSEDKTDSYSSEKSSAIYIFADTAWISGEYTLNVSAECNGIGISKEITIICE